MDGFEYIQRKPFEIFRIPDRSQELHAAIAVLAFCAYPDEKQMKYRAKAADALTAWIFRREYEAGIRAPTPPQLNRDALPAKIVNSRVYKACRRFEFEALPLLGVAIDLGFRKMDGYQIIARMLGSAFGAKHVTVRLPKRFDRDNAVFLEYLKKNMSSAALSDQKQALADFRRRKWSVYYKGFPLMAAIHLDALRMNMATGEYEIAIPGYGKRYLLISLLRNPHLWVPNIVQHHALRKMIFERQFGEGAFPRILGEDAVS